MRLRSSLRPLAGLLAALALAGCGGGGGAASSSSNGGSPATPGITLSALVNLSSPSGPAAISHLVDAMVIGDHAVLRSDSSDASDPTHPSTRFTIVDGQGNASASIDYGYTLAAGYNGAWSMQALPNGAGFALIQLQGGSKMFLFDAQAKLSGPAAGINLYEPSTASDGPSVYAADAAVDGNGVWVATTFKYPQTNGTAIYRIMLTKFDFSGKPLTPTGTLATSTKVQSPILAASAGALSLFWTDGTQPTLAYWAQGGGGPIQKAINTGTTRAALMPLALNGNGKLALVWGSGGATNGNLNAVALNTTGDAVVPTGAADWSGESLSSKWLGKRRGLMPGLDTGNGRLMVTDVVIDPAYSGDTILLADYTLNDGPLSAIVPQMTTVRRTSPRTIDNGSMLRQLVFSDHTLLLIGDADHVETAVVTRH